MINEMALNFPMVYLVGREYALNNRNIFNALLLKQGFRYHKFRIVFTKSQPLRVDCSIQ